MASSLGIRGLSVPTESPSNNLGVEGSLCTSEPDVGSRVKRSLEDNEEEWSPICKLMKPEPETDFNSGLVTYPEFLFPADDVERISNGTSPENFLVSYYPDIELQSY